MNASYARMALIVKGNEKRARNARSLIELLPYGQIALTPCDPKDFAVPRRDESRKINPECTILLRERGRVVQIVRERAPYRIRRSVCRADQGGVPSLTSLLEGRCVA